MVDEVMNIGCVDWPMYEYTYIIHTAYPPTKVSHKFISSREELQAKGSVQVRLSLYGDETRDMC